MDKITSPNLPSTDPRGQQTDSTSSSTREESPPLPAAPDPAPDYLLASGGLLIPWDHLIQLLASRQYLAPSMSFLAFPTAVFIVTLQLPGGDVKKGASYSPALPGPLAVPGAPSPCDKTP